MVVGDATKKEREPADAIAHRLKNCGSLDSSYFFRSTTVTMMLAIASTTSIKI